MPPRLATWVDDDSVSLCWCVPLIRVSRWRFKFILCEKLNHLSLISVAWATFGVRNPFLNLSHKRVFEKRFWNIIAYLLWKKSSLRGIANLVERKAEKSEGWYSPKNSILNQASFKPQSILTEAWIRLYWSLNLTLMKPETGFTEA